MRRRGFTLPEALVALTIGAVVLVALQGAVIRAAGARTRATARADTMAAARTFLLRIAGEIEAARPGLPFTITRDGGTTAIELATVARVGAALASDVQVVAYRFAPADGTVLRRAEARPRRALAPPPAEHTVLEGVPAFVVRAFDGTTWHDAWTGPPLPRGVEVTIELGDGTRLTTAVSPAARRP